MKNSEIITNLLTNIRTDVVNSMQANGRYATGETIVALEIVQDEKGGQLLAPKWVDTLEKGRGPTSAGAAPGDPPMIEGIKAWVEAKGLDISPWAIKKSIDKKGYPGKPGVLTEPLEMADKHISDAAEQIASNMQKQVADMLNVFDAI